ncbi:hypothetical protein B0J13DRAFT_531087 [Dactylonectria estremocensis]|uniref:Uncharacterized protein n=1 Tax=Dactylonectria estremocensis TaxID=1079267 RepID=A0A9P9DWX0_9HYPO|nr:hypothetical protein B0J13DRAFT_531087 [Dactylonectria estremocensis]
MPCGPDSFITVFNWLSFRVSYFSSLEQYCLRTAMPRVMRPKLPLRKPRSRVKDGPAFVFVDTAGVPSTGPEKNDAKTIVRRQAARSGRTRRQDESPNQENIATLPDSQELIPARKSARGVTSRAKDRYGI